MKYVEAVSFTGVWILLAVAFLLSFNACTSPRPEQPEDTTRRMLNAWVEAWNARDMQRVDELLADDCVYHDVPTRIYRGRAEVKDYLDDVFAWTPDIRVNSVSSFVAGDRAAIEWVWSGTVNGPLIDTVPELKPFEGKAFSFHGVSIIEVEEGRIKRIAEYYDTATFLYQLDLMFQVPEDRPPNLPM